MTTEKPSIKSLTAIAHGAASGGRLHSDDEAALITAITELESLRAENEALKARVDDLAMLIRLLVHSIRKHSPDNETARKAMGYLRRHELQGSPLRTTILSPAPDASKPNNQQEQP